MGIKNDNFAKDGMHDGHATHRLAREPVTTGNIYRFAVEGIWPHVDGNDGPPRKDS